MKHLQCFQVRKPTSIDVAVHAPGSENKIQNGNTLERYKLTAPGSQASSLNQDGADRIRYYGLYILMFVLTAHAVLDKIKNFYEKNVLATKEWLEVLRLIFLAVRNIAPAPQKIQSAITGFVSHISYGDLLERLLTQFKTIAPDLYAQINTIIVIIDTVVWPFFPYAFLGVSH